MCITSQPHVYGNFKCRSIYIATVLEVAFSLKTNYREHNSVKIQLPARTYEINYLIALIDLKLQTPSSNHEITIVSYTIDREGGCGTEIAKRI